MYCSIARLLRYYMGLRVYHVLLYIISRVYIILRICARIIIYYCIPRVIIAPALKTKLFIIAHMIPRYYYIPGPRIIIIAHMNHYYKKLKNIFQKQKFKNQKKKTNKQQNYFTRSKIFFKIPIYIIYTRAHPVHIKIHKCQH